MPGGEAAASVLPLLADPAERLYFEQTLRSKLGLTALQKQLKPRFWIPSSLYQSLRNRIKTHTKELAGMTYVYAAPRRTGKTTAGVAAIDLAARAMVSASSYACLYVDAGSSLRHNFRRSLGVPEVIEDPELIAMLAAELKPRSDGLPPDRTVYSNTLSQVPPVFVIDNVRVFSREDTEFLEILYKSCFASRILLFLFTDVDCIANMICGMNGKARIRPLPEMFRVEEETNDWEIVTDVTAPTGQVAVGIEWMAQHWTARKLTKIVKDRFTDFDWSGQENDSGVLTFVHDGDLPDAAMRLASNILTNSGGDLFMAHMNILDDPREDDNIG